MIWANSFSIFVGRIAKYLENQPELSFYIGEIDKVLMGIIVIGVDNISKFMNIKD